MDSEYILWSFYAWGWFFFRANHSLNQILKIHVRKVTGQGQGNSLWPKGPGYSTGLHLHETCALDLIRIMTQSSELIGLSKCVNINHISFCLNYNIWPSNLEIHNYVALIFKYSYLHENRSQANFFHIHYILEYTNGYYLLQFVTSSS